MIGFILEEFPPQLMSTVKRLQILFNLLFRFLNLGSAAGIALATAGGAAVGSSLGQLSEKGINHANDEKFQTEGGTFHQFEPENYVGEIILDGVLGGLAAGTTQTAGKFATRKAFGPSLKKLGGGGLKRYVGKRAVENVISKPVTVVAKNGIVVTKDLVKTS